MQCILEFFNEFERERLIVLGLEKGGSGMHGYNNTVCYIGATANTKMIVERQHADKVRKQRRRAEEMLEQRINCCIWLR